LVRMVGFKVDENLNMRLGEETKGCQVEYHRMGRVRVDKKIFGALWWKSSPLSVKDQSSGPGEQV
jgi:hypothetical protein